MKITVNTPPVVERKLVAVRGFTGRGIYFRNLGGYVYIGNDGIVTKSETISLEELMRQDRNRTPIYEGDTGTITF